ncbi:MAG: hypothetical protein DRQ10_04235 [Candidatus Hydrothermota bacterium]|nr:MAG: hypothetical protein DRQ10_04235 [Candidatus Hydrothermae bacterium]
MPNLKDEIERLKDELSRIKPSKQGPHPGKLVEWLREFADLLEAFINEPTPMDRRRLESYKSRFAELANAISGYFGWAVSKIPWLSDLHAWLDQFEFVVPPTMTIDAELRDRIAEPLVRVLEQAIELGKGRQKLKLIRPYLDIYTAITAETQERLSDLGLAVFAEYDQRVKAIDSVIDWAEQLQRTLSERLASNPDVQSAFKTLIRNLKQAKSRADPRIAIAALRRFKKRILDLIAKSVAETAGLILDQLIPIAKSPIPIPDADLDAYVKSLLDVLPSDIDLIAKIRRYTLPVPAEHANVFGWRFTIDYSGYVPGYGQSDYATCTISMSRSILDYEPKTRQPQTRKFWLTIRFTADSKEIGSSAISFTTRTVWQGEPGEGGRPVGMELKSYSISGDEETAVSGIYLLYLAMTEFPTRIGGRINTKPSECTAFGGDKDLSRPGCTAWTAIACLWSALSQLPSQYRRMAESRPDIRNVDTEYITRG